MQRSWSPFHGRTSVSTCLAMPGKLNSEKSLILVGADNFIILHQKQIQRVHFRVWQPLWTGEPTSFIKMTHHGSFCISPLIHGTHLLYYILRKSLTIASICFIVSTVSKILIETSSSPESAVLRHTRTIYGNWCCTLDLYVNIPAISLPPEDATKYQEGVPCGGCILYCPLGKSSRWIPDIPINITGSFISVWYTTQRLWDIYFEVQLQDLLHVHWYPVSAEASVY